MTAKAPIHRWNYYPKGIVNVDLVWHCQDWSVAIAARYKGYRYPIEVIGHAVWLYHRFCAESARR